MSIKTITRNLISSPLLAAIAYFSIMLIGVSYAKSIEKAKTVNTVIPSDLIKQKLK